MIWKGCHFPLDFKILYFTCFVQKSKFTFIPVYISVKKYFLNVGIISHSHHLTLISALLHLLRTWWKSLLKSLLTKPECVHTHVCMQDTELHIKEASMLSPHIGHVENYFADCTLAENVIFPDKERKVVF